jgi:long-subunit acyl-CoA synthetase (AMP-forming)
VPQILQGLVEVIEAGLPRPSQLRFVAVGGAPVAPRLLARARAAGLPVHEGYGLSECSSVVALNTAAADRPGSAGRPLPHVRISFAADGEILVGGNAFLGYVGEASRRADDPVATGDIGHLDDDGYLWLTGRKKNMFITAFGRNVAPEWIERELCLQPAIAQAAVFGEARPWNAAIIVPRPGASREAVDAALVEVNAMLPDYARVQHWLPAQQAFTPHNGNLTANGRLRRASLLAQYGPTLETLYQEAQHELL